MSLSHAPAVCARQRRGAAPGACTPAVGQRWSARKDARGGAARTSRNVRAPQAVSLRPGAVAPVPWSRDRSPGIARSSHSRPSAWQRRAAFGDPGSAPRTGGRGPPPPDSGAAAGSPQPLARVARPWCTTPGVSLSVVSSPSCCHATPCSTSVCLGLPQPKARPVRAGVHRVHTHPCPALLEPILLDGVQCVKRARGLTGTSTARSVPRRCPRR